MFDILILGGNLIDGSGATRRPSDIGISGDKIAAIGDLRHSVSRRIIKADGLTITPGFIDTHAHSDGALLIDPQHPNSIRQGITTELIGQDGLSYAPMSPNNYLMARHYLSGIYGFPPENIDTTSVQAFLDNFHRKTAVNIAYPVPHNAILMETTGFHDIPLEGVAMEKAKEIVREAMEQGSIGLSTGLSFFPNSWSCTSEIIELCKIVAEYGGVYITHLRYILPDRGVHLDEKEDPEKVHEALEIGRRSGVKIHFSHFRTDAHNAGQIDQLMANVDKGKSEGIDCTLELYPYPAGSGAPFVFLPDWASEGGPDSVISFLESPQARARIVSFLNDTAEDSLAASIISYVPSGKNDALLGLSFADIADDRGVSLGELTCDLLLEENLAVGIWWTPPDSASSWNQVSKDCIELLSRPDYMVGSDSITSHALPHPRAFGSFPRCFRLLRHHPIMSVEQMIQRMTDNPAKRFGLENRGQVRQGYHADLVVMDLDQVIDTATYDDPLQYPMGIPYVIVNGQLAVDHERPTGIMAGRALRKS